jgi:hypothetical protein
MRWGLMREIKVGRSPMRYLGARFMLDREVVRVFMDSDWRSAMMHSGLVRGRHYDCVQLLQQGDFDEWVTVDDFRGALGFV